MAERMLNFQNVRLDVVEAVRSGKRTNFLDAPAMRRMQLAQQQQLVQDQEAQHGELERVTLFEIADREREPTEDHKEQKMMGLMQPSSHASQSVTAAAGGSICAVCTAASNRRACCNLLAYANQLQQLPGDVHEHVQEEVADKLLECADQLRQARLRSLLPQPSAQQRSDLPMSTRPQMPESSTYIGLSQHAEPLSSMSEHHLPQRRQFQAAP
ncbi:MAG: hypothetical protein FRX49_08891 [Trebouxia sp. A1-2]|nr:MAG: hypothetical protein FRX49_08891 [Trebouxia sp. A1-2]